MRAAARPPSVFLGFWRGLHGLVDSRAVLARGSTDSSTPLRSARSELRGRLIPAGTGMPTYREIYLEKDEAPAQPSLEELLQRETEDEDALSLADFDDKQ